MPNDLTPVHLYILLHLKRAKVDYAKMIAKMSCIDLNLINSCIKDLIKAGLIERDSGSAIKRSKAKFKRAFEVRKHHTYYKLTKDGEQLVRKVDRKWLKEFFNGLIGEKAFKIIEKLKDCRDFKSVCKDLNIEWRDYIDDFVLYRLVTPNGRRTRLLELLIAFTEM